MRLRSMTGISALALAACGAPTVNTSNDVASDANATMAAPDGGSAVASLATADGAARGEARAAGGAGGLVVTVNAKDMTAGTYGVHIHTTGKCEGPKFESAGSHWNPTNKQHGADNPQGAHAGDLPNLTIAADGMGRVEFTIPGATVTGGAQALLDADGAAFMIHAKPDDYKTDPSGASGDRIACGVFNPG